MKNIYDTIQYNTIPVIPKISLLCDTPVLLAYKSTNFHNTPISSSFLFCIVKYAKWLLKKKSRHIETFL